MIRSRAIFVLTHAYPAWVFLHLIFGDWSTTSQLLFNAVPLIIFGSLFMIWKYSKTPLLKSEQVYINYLILMLAAITGYYEICTVSNAAWVYDHNFQMAAFVFVTMIFYIYAYIYER